MADSRDRQGQFYDSVRYITVRVYNNMRIADVLVFEHERHAVQISIHDY